MSDQTMDAALDRDKDLGAGDGKVRGKKRRKVSVLTREKIYTVDYKDTALLKKFLNDRGKILPMRQTGNTAKQQRMVATAIRRARELALLPYVTADLVGPREGGYRRERRNYEHKDQNLERAENLEAAAEKKVVEEAAPAPVAEVVEAVAPEVVAEATEAAE